jgi:serine/threonine-protein kinase
MPEQVSSYRLEEEIARGGMGIVYRGVHTVFDEVVAIKAIFPELTLNPLLRERFLNEAKIQRRLQHPNIVQIREFLIDQGMFYIVMEFVEGETLTERLRQRGRPMLVSEAADIFHQALEGLGYAHSHGVIHRDIKPSNIMLTREGVAKLTDFGIARALGSAKLTSTGTAMGTPAYMSPEQILGNKLDRRCDIYSLGITLYEMITGRLPFEQPRNAESEFPILAAHIHKQPTPPSLWEPGIPVAMEAAILKALAKLPENRYDSCQEFQAALAPFALAPTRIVSVPPEMEARQAAGPALVPKPPPTQPELRPLPKGLPPLPPRPQFKPPPKQGRGLVGTERLMAAALLLIVVVLAWGIWRRVKTVVSETAPQEAINAPINPQGPASVSNMSNPSANVEAPSPAPVTSGPPANPSSPRSAPAQIVVQTSPNAQVYLDESSKGRANGLGRLVINRLDAGDHTLRVSLAGKKDYEQRVVVAAGQQAFFDVTLADAERPALPTPGELLRPPTSTPRASPTKENPRDGLKYAWIPPGAFSMGCSVGDYECNDFERPAHLVTISRGFWMGQTPVTAGAYKRFADSSHRRMPPAPNFNYGWVNENMPIVTITWEEAQAYCGWIGGRLPTEAEWEYAARGANPEARYGVLDDIAWYNSNSGRQTHDVAQKRPNGFGLYDVMGNVTQWVNDWYDEHYYQNSPSQDPQGPADGLFRVRRGGGWAGGPHILRVSFRYRVMPNVRITDLGFRCAW